MGAGEGMYRGGRKMGCSGEERKGSGEGCVDLLGGFGVDIVLVSSLSCVGDYDA